MPSIEVTTTPDVDRAIAESWLGLLKRSLQDAPDEDDPVLTDCLKDAYDWAEGFMRRSLLEQILTVQFDAGEARSGQIWLPRPPVRSITSVTTYDLDDNATTVASSAYRLEGKTGSSAFVLVPVLVAVDSGWTLERSKKAVKVVYVAGYGDGATGEHASVPRRFVRAILRKAPVYFYEPVPLVAGTITATIESPESILRPSVYQ